MCPNKLFNDCLVIQSYSESWQRTREGGALWNNPHQLQERDSEEFREPRESRQNSLKPQIMG